MGLISLYPREKNLNRLAKVSLFILAYLFLFSHLKLELILKDALVTGGDTASHYLSAVFLKEHLLPQWRIMGWLPGNYAGFPLFQFYFPLPFLVMSLLSLVMPMTIAFRIISLAGVFTLPVGAYLGLKQMGFKTPEPELGMVFVLSFLFMEANSMWGGNIPSTLAGEFAYGMGLTLALIYLGRFYRGIESGRHVVSNALLLALIGLAHGYPLLFCVAGVSFFLITTRNWLFRLVYILKVNLLAFCFMGFWIVPLLLFLPYTVPYNFIWIIDGVLQVFPRILWPFIGLALVGAALGLPLVRQSPAEKSRVLFFVYLIFIVCIFYLIAPKIGMVDIRFVPFGQVLLVLLGAVGAGRLLGRFRLKSLAALALTIGAMVWIAHQVHFIGQWMDWNYTGYENKRLWAPFKELNDYLQGTFADPRVVYEHAAETRAVGTLRAFESLPLFAGRATLEGLYMQSSLSSPFVFYIQSEVSKIYSSPLPNYNYSRFDLARGQRHLELFNVSQYITVTEKARAEALRAPGLELDKEYPPFAIFGLAQNQNRYVIQPRFRPVLARSEDPKADAFTWFRWSDLEVPLVFAAKVSAAEEKYFDAVIGPGEFKDQVRNLPRRPLASSDELRETIKNNEIIIQGAVPGRPLWIKVSYHPNWRVEGADRVWRASPAFMLVFPTESRVRLYFHRTWPEYLGLGLSILGVFYALSRLFSKRGRALEPDFSTPLDRPLAGLAAMIRPRAGLILGIVIGLALTGLMLFILAVHYRDPTIYHNRGLKFFKAQNYKKARTVFNEALERFPLSPIVGQTLHHLALSYFNEKHYEEALAAWTRFPAEYPESRVLPEAFYHIGLCHLRLGRSEQAVRVFREVLHKFPDSVWAVESGRRLSEIYRPNELFQKAMHLFDQGRYREARILFDRTREKADRQDLKERAAYFSAISLFKAEEWPEALIAFQDLLAAYAPGEYTAEAYYHLGLVNLHLGAIEEGRKALQKVIDDYSETRWGRYSRQVMESLNQKARP
ncbi:MAG: tetratricopeptide repeat protein [Deltaproteobacteria bacterium]|nr:tetratricopeptide repeat protein [Deltaproteobacteria bacterium]